MNKGIEKAFSKGKAFIAFVTSGDPDLETTEEIVYAMDRAGCSLVELGIPLSNGVTTDKIFALVKKIRQKSDIPMVFMTYANVVYSYGIEKFCQKMVETQMSGMILPDVPYEEKAEFDIVCKKYGVDLISMIAPTSHQRIQMIAKEASGFIYCVSSLGVTGVRSTITTDIGAMVDLVRQVSDVPVAVGFGISTPEQAKKMANQSDGAIVGSAIVKIVEKYGKDAPKYVEEYVSQMVQALQ